MSGVKLTPRIRHILGLRTPKPVPGPSISRLSTVFTETFRDAETKGAESGWLVAAVSLFVFSLTKGES